MVGLPYNVICKQNVNKKYSAHFSCFLKKEIQIHGSAAGRRQSIKEMTSVMKTLSYINFIISILFMACYAYQAVYLAVSLFRRQKVFTAKKNHRYAVLIAARNEEAVIAQLQQSLSEVTGSTSWKATAPLRRIGKLFRKSDQTRKCRKALRLLSDHHHLHKAS